MPTRKPISPERLAANRANAAKSTGPRTSQGKSRSSQNSRKHGFTADHFAVVRLEEAGNVANLKADLVAVYQPVNAEELFAIERIALAQQFLLRVAALEAGIFTACINEAVDPDGHPVCLLGAEITNDLTITAAQNRAYLLAEGFVRQASKSNALSLFLRYQSQADRMYRRTIEEFDRLKALRSELPNEPIVQSEPEETTPVAAPAANPPAPPKPPFVPLQRPIPVDPTIAVTSPNPPSFKKSGKNGGE